MAPAPPEEIKPPNQGAKLLRNLSASNISKKLLIAPLTSTLAEIESVFIFHIFTLKSLVFASLDLYPPMSHTTGEYRPLQLQSLFV